MKDRFSEIAKGYAAFRPQYPKALYQYLYGSIDNFAFAWDAGTGNGQVATDLAKRFKKVYATDVSAKQLENAVQLPNIEYAVAGEITKLPAASVDLITVAQAIHWFDRSVFYDEVRRVAAKDAVVAVWGYGLLTIDTVINPMLFDFYSNVVGPFWDAERKLIDQRYTTIDFPFHEIETPEFKIEATWTMEEFTGYLNTWSAVRNFIKANQFNPVDGFVDVIAAHWGNVKRTVTFPVFLKMGKV